MELWETSQTILWVNLAENKHCSQQGQHWLHLEKLVKSGRNTETNLNWKDLETLSLQYLIGRVHWLVRKLLGGNEINSWNANSFGYFSMRQLTMLCQDRKDFDKKCLRSGTRVQPTNLSESSNSQRCHPQSLTKATRGMRSNFPGITLLCLSDN